jgi:sideroflexin-5
MVKSYFMAVGASCSVALGLNSLVPRLNGLSPAARLTLSRLVPFAAVASAGALNVYLMRGEEIRRGIDVYPIISEKEGEEGTASSQSLGKSKVAAKLAVGETALSRVINATPVMALPPLILVRLQRTEWLKARPRMVLPVNLGLIFTTSIFALPLALAVFPQRQKIAVEKLEPEIQAKVGKGAIVEFNRGI